MHRGHWGLAHARRTLREARGRNAGLAWHHALLLEPCPPLFFQLLLDFVDLLCQKVVVLRLEAAQQEGGRKLHNTNNKHPIYCTFLHPPFEGCLPCCLPTRTCLPLLSERRPPNSPSACPLAPRGQELGRWLGLCSHRNRKQISKQIFLTALKSAEETIQIYFMSFYFYEITTSNRLTACGQGGCEGPA